jgi:NADH dehydrogenase
MELLPIKVMTRDNIKSMAVDSVCAGDASCPFPFDFAPAAIEAIVPHYLAAQNQRAAYLRYRVSAGR